MASTTYHEKLNTNIEIVDAPVSAGPQAQRFAATLSTAGMTCAAYILAIKKGVQDLSYLESVSVSLLTNSATVFYSGPKSNIDEIVEAIEDRGFGRQVEAIAEAGSQQMEGEKYRRTIMLKIEGISNPGCSRVLETLSSAFPGLIEIEKQPCPEDRI